MRKSFTWILAVVVLITLGVLMACSAKYAASYNGLIVVPSQGSAVMQSFSLDLGNGHIQQINNVNGPPTPGIPTFEVLDPSGDYAYVIVQENAVLNPSVNAIASYSIASDGKLVNLATTPISNPVAIAIDSAGKFLFVANGTDGTVTTFSVGSNGNISKVGVTTLPSEPGGQVPDAAALAITPTVYPNQFAYCAGITPPSTENLYVADSTNYVLLNYAVSSSGVLKLVPYSPAFSGIPTGTDPTGVAVDPCNRFAYASNAKDNTVSAYKICFAVNSSTCQSANFGLQAVTGSPYTTGDVPGPLIVDPYGKFLYVVDTGSSQISGFEISSATGSLTAFTGAPTATYSGPTSITIRSDDSWMFVSNINSANVSQYAVTPATGVLTPQAPITTFNYPSSVAVK